MAYQVHEDINITADSSMADVEVYQRAVYDFEQIRLDHNAQGQRYLDGEISLAEWNAYKADRIDRLELVSGPMNEAAETLGYR